MIIGISNEPNPIQSLIYQLIVHKDSCCNPHKRFKYLTKNFRDLVNKIRQGQSGKQVLQRIENFGHSTWHDLSCLVFTILVKAKGK